MKIIQPLSNANSQITGQPHLEIKTKTVHELHEFSQKN
jgi:hypothetical protein